MSDYGSEVNNATLQLSGKVLEALLSLMDKLYKTWERRTSPEWAMNKERLKTIKDEVKRKNFAEKIEGMTGYVDHKDLVKAGVPLTVTEISMTKEELNLFSERCKREGITISAIVDQRELSLNENIKYIVECKQSDLKSLARMVDLMNDEKKIAAIDARKTEILLKGEDNLTEQDKFEIQDLDRQKQAIQKSHCYDLNDAQAKGISEMAVNGETESKISFNEALDKFTGGHIDKDLKCVVADATDPMRRIECHSQADIYKEKEYIKTDYEVFVGEESVYATNDGRFDGRPKDYWAKEKAAMQEKGGISDLVLKFYDTSEYEKYIQNYKLQNETELDPLQQAGETRDYSRINTFLENKLNDLGVTYDNGTLVDKENGVAMTLKADMSFDERMKVAEAQIIRKQIVNYKNLEALEGEVAIAKSAVLVAEEGTEVHTAATNEYNKVAENYDKALQKEIELVQTRKEINAAQSEHASRDEAEQEREPSDRESNHRTMNEYKEEINKAKEKDSTEKGNDVGAVLVKNTGVKER